MRRLRGELNLLEITGLLPAAGVAAVWGVLMFATGGFNPGAWLPAGLVLLGLLVVAIVGGGRALPPPGAARWALAALIAFTLWSFLSISWSDARGATWEAADLLLVVLLGGWTLALTPWRSRTAFGFMLALSAVAAAACLVALASALSAADLTSRFEDFRFSPPLDYPNTTAAFAFMAALPALLQAARPDASVPAKTLCQALATFLCAYALLPQSRGSVLGAGAALLVLFVVVSYRWRLTLHVGLVMVALAFVAGPAGRLYAAAETGRASDALGNAVTAILLATAAAAAAGLALALAEERTVVTPDRERAARLGGLGLAALVAVAIVGVGVTRLGSITNTLSDQWRALQHPGTTYGGKRANGADSRLASADPLERYDYWRVSMNGFRDNPLGGMSAGGFEHRYTLERRYGKTSRYPHNLVMKVLGDLGLVGAALIAAFLAMVVRGLMRVRRMRVAHRTVAAAAASTLAYFLAHGMFDWLEAYPVLAGPALAFPLIALGTVGRAERDRRTSPPAPPRSGGAWRLAWIPAGIAVLLAAVSLGAPWTALRYRDRATASWRTDPVAAYRDLRRSADLDPLSPKAPILLGAIALTRGDLATARTAFEDSLDREEAWLPHFGLGVIAAATRDHATAAREFAQAKRLDARDTVLPEVADRVLNARSVDAPRALRDVLGSPVDTRERIS